MTAPVMASPPTGEVAKVYSGIRDLEIQTGGEVGKGQKWPGGPYRPAERAAILVLGGGTLWWFDNSQAATTWPILAVGLGITIATVALMRFLIPRVRPSLAVRIMFLKNMFRPAHVVTSTPKGAKGTVELPEDDTLDPPERVDGNIVFTKGGVYAEYLLDGLPVLMQAYNVHDRAAKLTRSLGRYLPSGSIVRGLLVAEDQEAIGRAMLGSHANKRAWVRQCRQWEKTIAKPSKAVSKGYTGPVRARFWLTVPVDAGVQGRTALGQGKRVLDWISGRDKDSDTSLHHYNAVAREIVGNLPDKFNIRPASPTQILWHYTHRTGLGVVNEPLPGAGGPAFLEAKDFPRAAFDEGDNAHRPWWRPSFKPYVRIYNPLNPKVAASYQTFLTVEHFPDKGVRFPRATYLHSLLNVQTEAVIEWAQHINIRTPDQAKGVNFRYTKNIRDQITQRGERAAEDDELPKKLAHTRAYTAQIGSNPAERELDHTVIIAVGAATPEALDDAVKGIRQELDTVGIVVHRRRGAQLLLWKAFNTGSEIASPIDEFRNPTTAHQWSLFLPLISGRVGNVRGSALAVDQTTMRPSVILHDPEGTARRNKLTGLAIVGDPGGGKSHRTKLSVLELILRGGRAVIFEPDTIAEWRKALKPLKRIFESLRRHADEVIPEPRFIDPTKAEWCFDPLVIFPANIAARIAAAHILPWIGLSANSIQAKRYRRLLRPDSRKTNGITSHRALMDHLRSQPDWEQDELLLRLESAEEDFPGLFDDDLPAYRPDDSPATVYLTGNLGLPDAEDLINPHLYEQLSGPQRAGMAIYGLLIELEQLYMFGRQDIFDVMVFEECAELCAFPVTARIAHKITRRGRKHATGIWFVTQDFRDLARMGDKFIKQKWVFRVEDRELAELTLKWMGVDPYMYSELIDTLSQDTSPGNTREEDLIEEDEFGMTRVTEASAVDPDRIGEGFMVDEIGRVARVQFFGAPTEELAEAFDSTPLLAAA